MKNAIMTVDLDALLYNYNHLKCYYKKNIIAVLKDDAYGLGLLNVANTLKDDDTLIFALSDLNEIIKLRENNIKNEILYLNVFDEDDLETIIKYDITVVVQSYKQLLLIKNKNINFHLKYNSGMNRLGIYDYEVKEIINEINKNKYNLKGVMSHFANDDKDHSCYNKFMNFVKKINYKDLIIHCFASSSLNEYFINDSNYIRVGIKLYGIGDRNMFFHNVISITSPILEIKKINEHELVGYDYTFESKNKGYLYILPLGYSNGWGSFNNSFAYANNTYLKQAGKISMDYSTYFSNVLLDKNTTLELIGSHINIEQLCEINKIKPHELLVKLRLEKKYILTSI